MLAPLQQGHRLFLAISRDLFNSFQRNNVMPDDLKFKLQFFLYRGEVSLCKCAMPDDLKFKLKFFLYRGEVFLCKCAMAKLFAYHMEELKQIHQDTLDEEKARVLEDLLQSVQEKVATRDCTEMLL